MKVGLITPQGWKMEYTGWDPAEAWARTVELAKQAEELGFESLWAFDHFTTVPEPTDEMTLESFSQLSAIAMVTQNVRLGHMVICTSFRNPALTAKLASTIDVISGGRFEIGIGAGWKEDEWIAYGYGFPPIGERISTFEEHLEVISRMIAPGHASYEGERVHVIDAINEPRGIQPKIPLIVGGNGPKRTAGLAVKFADELNFVFRQPEWVAARMGEVRTMCEAAGRDPDTLRFSVYTLDEDYTDAGQARVDRIGAWAETGVDRIVCFPTKFDPSLEAQAAFAEDVKPRAWPSTGPSRPMARSVGSSSSPSYPACSGLGPPLAAAARSRSGPPSCSRHPTSRRYAPPSPSRPAGAWRPRMDPRADRSMPSGSTSAAR